jgi:tetratricopeptide (TPR) repeat protein
VTLNGLGTVMYHMGERREAIASYMKSIETKHDYVNPYDNLELALAREEYHPFLKQVIEFLSTIIKNNPGNQKTKLTELNLVVLDCNDSMISDLFANNYAKLYHHFGCFVLERRLWIDLLFLIIERKYYCCMSL